MAEAADQLIHLDLGDPAFPTPSHIIDAACRALKAGLTHYTESRGIREFREAVAWSEGRLGLEVDPDSEVLATLGASMGIYLAFLACLGRGDEVVIPSPCWFVYPQSVKLAGGRCVYVNVGDEFRLAEAEEALKQAINRRTRMMVVNTPHNPTGAVLNVDDLRLVRDLALDHDLIVLSDEIYKHIIYDDASHICIAKMPDMRERTILVNSLSKTYAMAGWRIGYVIAPKQVIDAMERFQAFIAACPPAFVQAAAVEALRGSQRCVEKLVRRCDQARKAALSLLGELERVRCPKPRGAFYLFPDLSGLGWESTSLTRALREKAGVSTMPGAMFGPGGEYHIRISYAAPVEQVREGVRRIVSFLKTHER